MQQNLFYCWSLNEVSWKNKMFCSLNSYKWKSGKKKNYLEVWKTPGHCVFECIQSFGLVFYSGFNLRNWIKRIAEATVLLAEKETNT